MSVFDLSEIEVADIDYMDVKHPVTGAATGWRLHIAGPGHPVTEAMSNEAARERLQKQRQIEQAQVNGRKYKADDVSPEDERRKFEGKLARRVVGWDPVTVDGQPFEYSPENARRLVSEPRWAKVQAQLLEFLGDEASFTKGSAKA